MLFEALFDLPPRRNYADSSGFIKNDQKQRTKGEEDAMEHLDIDKLREEFNRASASVRIVAVFSPT
jgi:hypothetical protein